MKHKYGPIRKSQERKKPKLFNTASAHVKLLIINNGRKEEMFYQSISEFM